jgi:hypothetical protein
MSETAMNFGTEKRSKMRPLSSFFLRAQARRDEKNREANDASMARIADYCARRTKASASQEH